MSASASLSAISIHKQLGLSQGQSQEGVNIRNPSTALLGVSSIDRYNNIGGEGSELVASETNPVGTQTLSSPYDFSISKNENFLNGFFTRLAVNEIQFRWTIPTLTLRNNKMYIIWSPSARNTITNAVSTGSTITFTIGSATTGYTAGQVIAIGNLPAVSTSAGTLNLNGYYTISSLTGTTFVCTALAPTAQPVAFTSLAVTGSVGIRYLITIPEGWYDLTNNSVTDFVNQGNLAYQVQLAVRTAITGATAFTCNYNFNDETAIAPYNCFISKSNDTSTFWFLRYTDPSQPNRVGLFEMMALPTNQVNNVTAQIGSPNASLLSTPFVDIVCTNLTYNQSLKDADTGVTRDILCRLFLTPDAFTGNMGNLGSAPILVHRAFPFPKQIKWNADQPIGNLRFQVYDSQGYLVTTADGLTGTNNYQYYDADMGDWSMTMLVSEV
jgi:hypothetical protein